MTNKLLLCLLILFTLPAHAQADKHQHHGRVGSHGMVLITDGEHLYASHLPLYRRPHDYQLIYQVSTKQSPQLMAQLQQGMVTLLPENFDLNQLIEGQNFTVKAVFSPAISNGADNACWTPQLHLSARFTDVD